MINIWNYTVFIFVGLIFSSYATAAEKSVGAKLGYDFAHSACEPQSSDCDNQSLSGGIYFRHNIYDPYFYQVSFEYLGRFKSTYPALAHPTMDADYTGDVYGLGLSGGRVFSLAQKHQLVTQLGLMSWYVKTKVMKLTIMLLMMILAFLLLLPLLTNTILLKILASNWVINLFMV